MRYTAVVIVSFDVTFEDDGENDLADQAHGAAIEDLSNGGDIIYKGAFDISVTDIRIVPEGRT